MSLLKMSLFKKKKLNVPVALVAVNTVVAILSTFITVVLTITTLLKRLD
ncbi:hypothetical protein HQ544_04805 [Candidatus Falkowbacteria bacterium]|nr:hypothetical protein [Candidatus Falkowbacteria bacterium]